MIDIHCHMLYGVDDGPKHIEESVAMLKEAKNQGISAIVLTPHYRHGMFPYKKEDVDEHYETLLPYAKKLEIGLYTGCEYHVNRDVCSAFSNGRVHSLADGRSILTEYSHVSEYSFLVQMTREVTMHGYIPVIAHVERYGCLVEDMERIEELRNIGAMIQVNADAVLGMEGRSPKKFTRLLLEEGLVDVIASDCHGIRQRVCHMKKCYDYVAKKFGEEYAEELMQENPATILAG